MRGDDTNDRIDRLDLANKDLQLNSEAYEHRLERDQFSNDMAPAVTDRSAGPPTREPPAELCHAAFVDSLYPL